MKHGHKTVVCLVGGLALLGQVGARAADSEDNPYSDTIVTRNIFSLKPPPALPAITEPCSKAILPLKRASQPKISHSCSALGNAKVKSR